MPGSAVRGLVDSAELIHQQFLSARNEISVFLGQSTHRLKYQLCGEHETYTGKFNGAVVGFRSTIAMCCPVLGSPG